MPTACRLEETKRISRAIEIVQMIAVNPGRYLRRDLADHFEISERMIQKVLDIIRHGLKLELLHTASGCRFSSIENLPTLYFTLSETLSLSITVEVACRVPGTGSYEPPTSVAGLKPIFHHEFIPLLNKIAGQPNVAGQWDHRQQVLSLLNNALAQCYKVKIEYEARSRSGRTYFPCCNWRFARL